jgi:hypothetical protein
VKLMMTCAAQSIRRYPRSLATYRSLLSAVRSNWLFAQYPGRTTASYQLYATDSVMYSQLQSIPRGRSLHPPCVGMPRRGDKEAA